MQVVILAGGLGTRIHSLAQGLPKSLLPVGGRPFIEHQFELLHRHGLNEILLCVGFGATQIASHVGDGGRWGMQVLYSYDAVGGLMGTGGTLIQALPLLAEHFLVLYGDSYLPFDYGGFVSAFRRRDALAMMSVFRNLSQWDKSNVRVDGGRVTYYSKQATPRDADYIDYGLTGFRKSVIERFREVPRPFDLSVVLSPLVASGELMAYEVHERFYEIGKPEGVADLDAYLQRGLH